MMNLETSQSLGLAVLKAPSLESKHVGGITIDLQVREAATVAVKYFVPQGALQPVMELLEQYELKPKAAEAAPVIKTALSVTTVVSTPGAKPCMTVDAQTGNVTIQTGRDSSVQGKNEEPAIRSTAQKLYSAIEGAGVHPGSIDDLVEEVLEIMRPVPESNS